MLLPNMEAVLMGIFFPTNACRPQGIIELQQGLHFGGIKLMHRFQVAMQLRQSLQSIHFYNLGIICGRKGLCVVQKAFV